MEIIVILSIIILIGTVAIIWYRDEIKDLEDDIKSLKINAENKEILLEEVEELKKKLKRVRACNTRNVTDLNYYKWRYLKLKK